MVRQPDDTKPTLVLVHGVKPPRRAEDTPRPATATRNPMDLLHISPEEGQRFSARRPRPPVE
jgi:hypothetical protein